MQPDHSALATQHAEKVADLCRLIEGAEQQPTLDELATRAGLSAYHLHRVFKQITGLTPKGYARANRARRMRQELGQSDTVTQAIYGAGYGSNGRFYGESDRVLGMTPSRYRAGGADTQIRFAVGECSLGSILVAQSDRGVCAILMGDDPDVLARELQDRFPRARLIGGDAEFEQLVAKVVGLVEAPGLGLTFRSMRGTAFQQRVWRHCARFPPAKILSYAHSPEGSVRRTRSGRWHRRAAPIPSPWPSPAIAWCETTAACRGIAGAWSESTRCLCANPGGTNK